MAGNEKQDGGSNGGTSRKGITYDIFKRTLVDGKQQLKRHGLVFIRNTRTGGVAWVFGADGEQEDLVLFARKERNPEPAAGAPAQAA